MGEDGDGCGEGQLAVDEPDNGEEMSIYTPRPPRFPTARPDVEILNPENS